MAIATINNIEISESTMPFHFLLKMVIFKSVNMYINIMMMIKDLEVPKPKHILNLLISIIIITRILQKSSKSRKNLT